MTNEIVKTYWALVWNRKQWMLQRKWLMFVMLDACRRCLTPWIKATVSSIITDFVIAPEVMASQLQLWHVVVNKLYKDHQKQLCGALGRGGMLAGSSRSPVCLFCQWILIGSSVCKEEEGTGSFQVMQYMIYVNLGICKTFWAVENLCYY